MKKPKEEKRAKVLESQLARALADYDNLRKRIQKERETQVRLEMAQILGKFIAVYDLFLEVQKHLKDSGLAIALGAFEEAFREEGLEMIKVKPGSVFDEAYHEAIETVDKQGKEGEIVEVVKTGWQLAGGQVIRPAKVKVNKKETHE